VAAQAAEGSIAAQQVQNLMAYMYQGGVKNVAKGEPIPPAPVMPAGGYKLPYPTLKEMGGYHPQSLPYPSDTKVAGVNIGGWTFNIPYRTNLRAAELDKGNPLHIARGLYSRGLKE